VSQQVGQHGIESRNSTLCGDIPPCAQLHSERGFGGVQLVDACVSFACSFRYVDRVHLSSFFARTYSATGQREEVDRGLGARFRQSRLQPRDDHAECGQFGVSCSARSGWQHRLRGPEVPRGIDPGAAARSVC
jgi:hypothetical protein